MTIETSTRRVKRLPPWLRRSIPLLHECAPIERTVGRLGLHTICREGLCPNRAECYAGRRVTFLILGDTCTRSCRFCAVRTGKPSEPDPGEPERIALAAGVLDLRHVVVTSVTRDDLPDGGAAHFASVVGALREIDPAPTVEVLVPDFRGSREAIERIAEAGPDIICHNMETVRRLYGEIRRGADYDRSLRLLHDVKTMRKEVVTKSSFMLGLGETMDEVLSALTDLRRAACDCVAFGQYLRPGLDQVAVAEYLPPARFSHLRHEAYRLGFRDVSSGPLVRSSYREIGLGDRGASSPLGAGT